MVKHTNYLKIIVNLKNIFSGYNFRPTEYCAAIIKEQIKRRHEINKFRIRTIKKLQKRQKIY